ncbi:branched-chain amino acid ABC transporter substrate-binding protein [Chryseobacterium turcicum]|uniref:Branched-chain amino acid ABC transporter substrate-binding protein n=1 Tax=Chryseobacterium turcicum TaxID=2898076 RepID=A0A9Q3V4K5_9FLAO|nr:branched-chain amino acid ABC transporter substrate-binding protein [Chryseobacterium turcicum]MCD1118067.1 branched-chain amino acid ABC transporter substrate-binding protein [Chryseobacterium turcicum]
MPFNIFDGLDVLLDLLSLDFSKNSSSKSPADKKFSKKSKYTTELWSGSFLAMASILYFIVFKDSLPKENYIQSMLICILIGFLISFVLFFSLYHLGLFYFKSLFKLLLFSFSIIVFIISIVVIVYFKSGILY